MPRRIAHSRMFLLFSIVMIAVLLVFAVAVMQSSKPGLTMDVDRPVVPLLLASLLVSVATALIMFAFHFYFCRLVFVDYLQRSNVTSFRIALAMMVMFTIHLLEMQIYGLIMFGLAHGWQVGSLEGFSTGSLADFIYFSIACYTSLGFGDIYPTGGLRLFAGLETLSGLLMIGWTTALFIVTLHPIWLESVDRD
ncbi:MAG: potassium channel family protein [Pseudomonadota bacterium]